MPTTIDDVINNVRLCALMQDRYNESH